MEIIHLDKISYEEAYEFQLKTWKLRVEEKIPDTLIICEHDPVFTIGRKGPQNPPPSLADIPIVPVERGGSITYHGPGQIMGYLIADSRNPNFFGPKKIYSFLGDALIYICSHFKVNAEMLVDPRGLWTKSDPRRKLGSFGIAIRSNVTFHGFCLNVSPNFDHFALISPCDLSPSVMSSLNKERNLIAENQVSLKEVKDLVLKYFLSS